ncbi:hypothetical protein [Enterococcus florum]|uniref:hypothetical protein n=1 Tax=Enterococcus florum TaxID=2480627 RepID=UPI0011BACFCE|nr:hypothetical protein [Enterococcus florum]
MMQYRLSVDYLDLPSPLFESAEKAAFAVSLADGGRTVPALIDRATQVDAFSESVTFFSLYTFYLM